MPIEEIRTICFVGAGQVGCFNSLAAAASGYQVKVYDRSREALESLGERHRKLLEFFIAQKVLPQMAARSGLENVKIFFDPAEAAADADLLSESVPERLELKREVHRQFDGLCPPKTILTTNTSTMLVSELESAVGRPDRFAALHSHLGTLLFDVVGGPRTNRDVVDILVKYVQSLGGTPIVHSKERRGYLANTLFGALTSAGLRLAASGAGLPTEIDRAWIAFQKGTFGPFSIMDFVGLDLVADIWEQRLREKGPDPEIEQNVAYLRPYIQSGRLGFKTGEGFYKYPHPEFGKPGFVTAEPVRRELYVKLVRTFLAAALGLVYESDASPHDIDLCWTVATVSPLGPFGLLKTYWPEILANELMLQIERMGINGIVERLAERLMNYA